MKKKSLLVIFLVALMVGGLSFINQQILGVVNASTNVSSIVITSDTTWTKANSPYNLAGNVLIESGVTVTVETDAVLNLNDYYIRVNGTLILQPGVTININSVVNSGSIQVNGVLAARGTTNNPIYVNGAVSFAYLDSHILFSRFHEVQQRLG